MFANWSRHISVFFSKKGIIKASDIDVYAYSFEMLLSTVSNLLLLLIYGILSNQLIVSIVFSAMFLTLRPVCGGIHATNHFWCCFTVLCIFSGVLLLLWYTPSNLIFWVNTILAVMGLAVIWLYAPVEDPHKPLNEKEVAYFRRKARTRSFFFAALVIISNCFLRESKILYTMGICMLVIACMMLIAKYNNFRRKNHENLENTCP